MSKKNKDKNSPQEPLENKEGSGTLEGSGSLGAGNKESENTLTEDISVGENKTVKVVEIDDSEIKKDEELTNQIIENLKNWKPRSEQEKPVEEKKRTVFEEYWYQKQLKREAALKKLS